MNSGVKQTNWFQVVLSLIVITMLSMFAIESYASDITDANSGLVQTLCKAIMFVQGGVGKAIAIIVIISIAIMMFLGKITWGVAIAVAVGIGLLFGAESVVNAVAPSASGGDLDCKTIAESS